MKPPETTPALNPLPFIIADLALLLAAVLIVIESPDPFAPLTLVAAVACAGLGAILLCVPFVLNHTRRRDAELNARQSQLATLAQTAAAAANQLDRAAATLGDITDATAKMLKQAAQLPAHMQEKIGEFKTQLNEVAITENESLAQEIATLRASETERLETTLAAIQKTAADLAALETATQQRAAEISDTLATHVTAQTASLEAAARKHAADIRDAITFLDERFTARATEIRDTLAAHATATAAAVKTLDAASADAGRALAASIAQNTATALARLDEHFTARARALDDLHRAHEQKLRALPPPAGSAPAGNAPAGSAGIPLDGRREAPPNPPVENPALPNSTPAGVAQASEPARSIPNEPEPPANNPQPSAPEAPRRAPEDIPPKPAPKTKKSESKKQKPEPPPLASVSESETPPLPPAPVEATTSEPATPEPAPAGNAGIPLGGRRDAPPETPGDSERQRHSANPALPDDSRQKTADGEQGTPTGAREVRPHETESAAGQAVETPASTPTPRKRSTPKPRAPKQEKPADSVEPPDEPPPADAPPPADEYSQTSPDEAGDFSSALSADGVTRLLVTAYIGIGNKVHIRGDGPGLSWDKGVPLQFVSIGKWRWETPDATAPIAFKLYKNDTQECTALGALKLNPGHQHEVTANF